jgi:hypothetical protein
MRGGVLVELDRNPSQLLDQRPVADDLGGAVEIDVLVVVACLCLGRGGEDRTREAVGLPQARGQLDPAHRPRLAVLPPPRAREIPTHHALHRVHPEPTHPNAASGDLLGHLVGEKVICADLARAVEPEQRHLRQDAALVGYRVGHDHVVGRDSIRGHHQEIAVELVHLADLAGGVEAKIGEGGDRHGRRC